MSCQFRHVITRFFPLLLIPMLAACGSTGPESAWQGVQDAWAAESFEELQEHVAVEELVTGAVDDVFAIALEQTQAEAGDEWEQAGAELGAMMLEGLKPQVIADAIRSIELSFQEGQVVLDSELPQNPMFGGTPSTPRTYRVPLDSVPLRVTSVEVSGRTEGQAELLVSIEDTDDEEEHPLRFRVEQREGRWMITGLIRLDALMEEGELPGRD